MPEYYFVLTSSLAQQPAQQTEPAWLSIYAIDLPAASSLYRCDRVLSSRRNGQINELLVWSHADNAAMIAHVGVSRLSRQRIDPLSVDIKSKWSIEECELDFDAE